MLQDRIMGKHGSARLDDASERRRRSGQHPRLAARTIEDLAERLRRLCEATGLEAEATARAESVFRSVIVPWSRVERSLSGEGDEWLSEISDDNTPIEFSVTLSPEGAEVRVLFEPQGDEPTLASHRAAALAMHECLERDYQADLSRFRRVLDVFLPPDMQGPFALWSAVVFSNRHPPAFKAYFNPQARGAGRAAELVTDALRRLDMPRAVRTLACSVTRRDPHRDELKYFALDLSHDARARVKVYVRHHDATPEDLELVASAAPGSNPGEALQFARAMGGGAECFRARATFSCAAFVEGETERPAAVTHYVPVCAYSETDAVVEERVAAYLSDHGLATDPYRSMLRAFANRPLAAGVGMQSWVAFRRYQNVPRLTIYLGSEARRVHPPGSVPARTSSHMSFRSLPGVLGCLSRYDVDHHPQVVAAKAAGDLSIAFVALASLRDALASVTPARDGAADPAMALGAARLLLTKVSALVDTVSGSPLPASHADTVKTLTRCFRATEVTEREAAIAVAGLLTDQLGKVLAPPASVPPTRRERLRSVRPPPPDSNDECGPNVVGNALDVHAAIWACLSSG
jgi:hypothetical protein